MKKILQIMALFSTMMIISYVNSFAQSLELTAPETNPDVISCEPEDNMVESEPMIKNLTNAQLSFRVSITPVHLVDGHKFSMCDMNTCYPESTEYFVTPQDNVLSPGGSSGHSMYIYLSPYGVKGTTELKVRFFNVANADDYVEYTVKYAVGTTDVNNNQSIKFSVESLMPNPVNNFINYKFSSTSQSESNLKIYSENGSLVKSVKIPAQSNSYMMNTNDMINGRYYFMLNTGKNNQEQGNFIISR